VIAAGLIWVGPSPESIEAMGLKDAAKQLMRAAGVPVTPGYDGEDQSSQTLQREADSIGYPVLIKAVAGGGGKGMRKVDDSADFLAALESCKREAKSSFANDEVLLEKWIASPRHIEVQVFGDSHGNVVHLFERDCSLQRRHQKVIEEAPAPGMDAATREAICAAAVRAAKAVDYVGAGTIEFIADASEGLKADRIFFMEMNTRLQVEHPVTEEITGVDLVEWQLRVASGEPLPLQQDELSINGHAIEARLYAEDPAKGFLPSTGRLERFRIPAVARPSLRSDNTTYEYEADVRIEAGIHEGDEISPFYDPMIAKVVAHADDREEAACALARVLGDIEVWPVQTNATFLTLLARDVHFLAGNIDTGLIERKSQLLAIELRPSRWMLDQVAEALAAQAGGPRGLEGFRLNARPVDSVRMQDRQDVYEGSLAADLTPRHRHAVVLSIGNGAVYATELGGTWRFSPARTESITGMSSDGDILAPMPGKVIAVDVAEGQAVEAGQRLMVLEAMKMEHALTAPFAGTVAELAARIGSQVQVEALLARVVKAEG